ncbi:DNA internalization-related competence protein ComEC/Rec2 [Singulisphaera sp. PoT]|uniref:DNA internalization-related competence protein ComEC/Rec2 n=1 Tax=Singulisphaera sp. PoT TaxID=3411797 RepID=UPI003BF569F6
MLDLTGINDGRDWHRASGAIQLVILGERNDLEAGQAVEAAGSLAAVAGPLNPGEFDYRAYLRAQGIRVRLTIDSPEGVWQDERTPGSGFDRWIGAARAWSHGRLVAGLDPRVAPLAAALLLGRREGVDPEVNDAFARTGTTHLLAISGLHLQVLAGALWFLFRMLGFGRRGAFLAVALTTLGYALLVGLMPSVVRSAAMTMTACVAGMRDRRTRFGNILALAAIVTMMLNPSHLFDVGCQLSFLAIATIVWGVGPLKDLLNFFYHAWTFRVNAPGSALDRLERKLEPWWLAQMRQWPPLVTSGILVSFVVWLVGLPLVMLRFHIISPIGILLNIPLIPLTSLALMTSGLTLLLSPIWPTLALPTAWLTAIFLRGTEWLVRWGATRSWGHIFVAGPHWGWVVVVYLLLTLAMVARAARSSNRRYLWGALALVVVSGPVIGWFVRRPDTLEADILAVGHGLAVVVQGPDGRAIIYDCGRMRDPSVGRRIIAPALWSRGISHVEMIILSHADSDHYNGLPELLDRFSIGAVRVAPGFAGETNPGAVALLNFAKARGVPVEPIAERMQWEWAGARYSVRFPPSEPNLATSDNARSVVLDIESQGRDLLLTGDLEEEGLVELTKQPRTPVDVILSPHHGGRTANPDWFYDWANPKVIAVSQRPPTRGTRDALESLEGAGIPLYRTWKQGAIRLRWEAGGLTTRGFLDPPDRAEADTSRPQERPAAGMGLPGLFAVSGVLSIGVRALAVISGLAVGLGAALVLAVREWGAWALVLPGRRFGASEVDDGGERIEVIAPDGVRLVGTWHPGQDSPGRTIFLVHGFAEVRSAMRDRVEFLNARGWNVAQLDLRAYGRSGGNRASFGGREGRDLIAWVDVLAPRCGPSPKFAAWGRSMGAAIVCRAAAEDDRLDAIILESPYTDLETAVVGWLRKARLPFGRIFARLILDRARRLAGVSLSRPSPIELAPTISAATLLIHGSIDPLVTRDQADRLTGAFPAARRIEVPGAGHGNVVEVGGPELVGRILEFLDEAQGFTA